MDCSKVIRLVLIACLGLSLSRATMAHAQSDASAEDSVGPANDKDQGAISDSAIGVEDDLFRPGGSCAALAYLSSSQLADLIKAGFSDDRHSFCYPEEPSECTEYTSLLQGRGHLSTGEDGFHCNLQVNS
ncbi:MAG: hypothetical protein NTZ90_09040 [Proteobacteria bacterium]|nr:hypothetical protein [Pseudomonadota bacterium]